MDGPVYAVGDRVQKTGGDYRFEGVVVAVFRKLSGAVRLVVEDERGLLLIWNEKQVTPAAAPARKRPDPAPGKLGRAAA